LVFTFSSMCAVAFAAVGAIGVATSVFELIDARASRDWPRALGRIGRSRVEEIADAEGVRYRPDVLFRYTVDGRELSATRVRFGPIVRTGWRWVAERELRRYPNGRDVTIAYDPADPSQAVLEPGATGGAWRGIITFGVVTALGIALAVSQA
jgi:hypothetical protein